jgi:hypothetical protein
MRLKIVLAITGFVLLHANQISAQTFFWEEALMLSRITSGGSARIQAMGGVQNSLGGDISSASYNPAGLGMYNRSDFSFTPGYIVNNSTSSFLGNNATGSKSNLFIPNIGIGFTNKKDATSGLLSGTFGISYNRTNDFNHTYSYSGENPTTSIVDYFIDQANGAPESQFYTGGDNYNTRTELGYQNFLIGPKSILNPPGSPTEYFTDVSGVPLQSETIKTKGSQSQVSISYGVNFNDKFFVGGSLGLASLNYDEVKTYSEKFSDSNQPMSEMVLTQNWSLSGSGVNLTLGTIFRPAERVQLGISIATPTAYTITDNFHSTMTTAWKNFPYATGEVLKNEEGQTDQLTSNYNLSTPWRFSGGATYFIGKRGFISADVEYMKYSSATYSSDTGDDYTLDNKDIKEQLKSVVNLRFGGEYRLNDLRFRGGYSIMPDPFQHEQYGVDRTLSSFSAGFGYRIAKFYADFAAVFGYGSYAYQPYTFQNLNLPSPVVTFDNKSTKFMITIGFPF